MKFYTMWFTALLMAAFFMTGCGLTDPPLPVDAVAVAPTVASTLPASIATDVAINANIKATFSTAMNPLTITDVTFTLKKGLTPVAGVVTYSGLVATFNPDANLDINTVYTATITIDAQDIAGIAMAAEKTWTFTTGAVSDVVNPTVSSTFPVDTAVTVAISGSVTATFSEIMDDTTITDVTFTLKQGLTPIAGVVTYNNLTATFNPNADLSPNLLYTATITIAVADIAGNLLAVEKVWTFTTGSALEANPAIVNLGTAGNFTIFSKTMITTTGVTSITGDIGISAVASAFSGFALEAPPTYYTITTDPLQVTGKVYAVDYDAPTPTNMGITAGDMEAAYTAASSRPVSSGATDELGGGTIAGLTLYRGVYKWTTVVNMDIANVTLKGGPDDVFILITTKGFSMTGGSRIILSGGAQAKNIFWVAAETVLTTGSEHFEGTILGMTMITLESGTTVNGRLLGQSHVTLIGNTITPPTP